MKPFPLIRRVFSWSWWNEAAETPLVWAKRVWGFSEMNLRSSWNESPTERGLYRMRVCTA